MPFAVAVGNGTAALHLALLSVGVGPGDEVIVPDFTFAATASTGPPCGSDSVFVDVDPSTWTLDAGAVADAVTERTTAIVPVAHYGHPCDMPPLVELARDRGLRIVEDDAEALGARAHGQLTGTFGDVACFSFYGNKTLTTGEGGMIVYKRRGSGCERVASSATTECRPSAGTGISKPLNYRLTNLQAAVGVAQMERVDEILQRKRTLAEQYAAHVSGVDGISLPPHAAWADPVCWLYTVRVEDELGLTRDELASRLLVNGIETRPVFEPLHLMPPFERFAGDGSIPGDGRDRGNGSEPSVRGHASRKRTSTRSRRASKRSSAYAACMRRPAERPEGTCGSARPSSALGRSACCSTTTRAATGHGRTSRRTSVSRSVRARRRVRSGSSTSCDGRGSTAGGVRIRGARRDARLRAVRRTSAFALRSLYTRDRSKHVRRMPGRLSAKNR